MTYGAGTYGAGTYGQPGVPSVARVAGIGGAGPIIPERRSEYRQVRCSISLPVAHKVRSQVTAKTMMAVTAGQSGTACQSKPTTSLTLTAIQSVSRMRNLAGITHLGAITKPGPSYGLAATLTRPAISTQTRTKLETKATATYTADDLTSIVLLAFHTMRNEANK